MQRNVAGQKWRVLAFDRTTSNIVEGDAANITAKISKDFAPAVATNDVNPTELEGGYYEFDLTQAETDADDLLIICESSTANVIVLGCTAHILTTPVDWSLGVIQTGDSFTRIGAGGAGLTLLATLSQLTQTDLTVQTVNNNVLGISSRVGAFTGSGVNTILGFFRAIMRVDASIPSDVGGTYDPATDSLESPKTLTTAERDAIAAALLDLASAIDGKTPRQTLRYMAAALVGKLSGAGTGTEIVKGMDGTTTRATYTVDGSGNRSNVVYNG